MSIRRIDWNKLTEPERQAALRRPVEKRSESVRRRVAEIVETVRSEGDIALRRFTSEFDGIDLETFRVDEAEFEAARKELSTEAVEALRRAAARIEAFHAPQIPRDVEVESPPGVRCFRRHRAIERVGLYVPGGTAPLPSTALMLTVPARVAGCDRRIVCTPPRRDGTVHPAILVAAEIGGATDVFRLGGAQAIAAMAFGTESIPHVDKIYGPGNAYVTEAKLHVAGDPDGAGCDLPAGPSEVLVLADDEADPEWIAADLLSQAEHGVDSQVVCVALDDGLLDAVARELDEQLATLSRREIAASALDESLLIRAPDLTTAFAISNRYAPEHLILHVRDPEAQIDRIRHAGSVFLGPWAPESVGDYASGTNHVLPTSGFARRTGGLSVDSFLKAITFQFLRPEGLAQIGPIVETLADLEGLDGHRQAVSRRLARLRAERTASGKTSENG